MVNKFINLRGSGKKPEGDDKSKQSKDKSEG
jgi:hypothetical protein